MTSYELHVSDVYMPCYYNEDTGAPLFATFF